MSIGQKLLSLRKQKGISQQELASYLNVSRQTISKFEHDLSLPDMDLMLQIAQYYQISINELLGIEETTNDITDLYNQMQSVLEHIQKNNQRNKIGNFILIIICVFSLGLTMFMVNKMNEYETMLISYNKSFDSSFLVVNQINNDHQIFIEGNQTTYMEIEKCDLEKEMITLNYQFTLRNYTKETKVNIEFHPWAEDETYKYTLTKVNNNTFVFHQTIPLYNYDRVDLIINDGKGNIVSEDIGFNDNCDYLRYVLQEMAYVYVPVDKDNQLMRDRIIFDPEYNQPFVSCVGTLNNNWHLIIQMYNQKGICLLDVGIPMNEKKIINLKEKMAMNEDIYISIVVEYLDKEKGQSFHLFDTRGENNKVQSSFQLTNDHQKYLIYPK